ncbi:MAG TPA: DinB family protein [Holophagaceae bacterium]|nr:DinB family protein [Holophagaceae bacterium]HJW09056.1 DinB family protein [Holophagaceae bacterium]
MDKPDRSVLTELAATPRRLAAIFLALEPELHRVRPPFEDQGQPFAFVEHVWHMADLETEAFQIRLRRLREEERPILADFDGAAAARRRDYLALDPAEGLRRFAAARARSLETLSHVRSGEWSRRGAQEGAGELSLADLPCRMLIHDRGHLQELQTLLKALRRDALADLAGAEAAPVGACA